MLPASYWKVIKNLSNKKIRCCWHVEPASKKNLNTGRHSRGRHRGREAGRQGDGQASRYTSRWATSRQTGRVSQWSRNKDVC